MNSVTDWAAWIGAITGVLGLVGGTLKYFLFERRDQRQQTQAFIEVSGASISLLEDFVLVHFKVINSGQSAATNIKFNVSLALVDQPQFIEIDAAQLSYFESQKGICPRLGSGTMFELNIRHYLTENELLLIKDGLKVIYLKGELFYTDIFQRACKMPLDSKQSERVNETDWTLSALNNG